MYVGVPGLVWWTWLGAVVALSVTAGHRLWLVGVAGRRDKANLYLGAAVLLAVLFLLTRYPSPIRYGLDLYFPRTSLVVNYSLVLWVVFCLFGIAREIFAFPSRNLAMALGITILAQVGTAAVFTQVHLEQPFSLSATARDGDWGALAYLLQMVLFCGLSAVYLAGLLLRLARRTRDQTVRGGQELAAGGLLVLALGAIEEVLFLVIPGIPMRTHGVLISVLITGGVMGLSAGVLIFSPAGRWGQRLLWEASWYARLRPLGRAIARAWPDLCLGEHRWWDVLTVWRAGELLHRVVIEVLDLRRTLVGFVPDAELPTGPQVDPIREARYLAQGLHPGLTARPEPGDPRQLAPFPAEPVQTYRFLLQVRQALQL